MKTKLGATLLGFSYMTLGLVPAYADDTEIFLGSVSADMVKPNILFILDNSGSMSSRVSGNSGPTRMEALQDSMAAILNSVEGVNAGFMRFNAPGGSILYPVTDLDQALDQYWKLRSTIQDSSDDAVQNIGVGVSSAVLNGTELTLGALPTALNTVNYSISSDTNDAAERNDGEVRRGDDPLRFQSSRITGFRFTGINIPPQADIYSAQLQFRSERNETGDLDLIFTAEDTRDSAAFSTNDNNISNRNQTNRSVTWRLGGWSDNTDYVSPDISPVVKEVIDGPNWTAGNALTIIQHAEGDGSRRIASRETSSQRAAKLEIQYQDPGGTYDNQHVGLRFQNLSIPRGATITNAYIEVTSSSNKSGSLGLQVALQDDPNPSTFESTGLTGAATIIPAVNWDTGDWEQDETIRSPSLITPLQSLVNDAEWCGGNAVAFHITPQGSATSSRTFYSADHGEGKAPRLIVEYDPASVPAESCNQVTLRFPISGRPNDADERTNDTGSVTNDGNNLRLYGSGTQRRVGLRFENLPLKKNAIIEDARIIFTAGSNDSGSVNISFQVQDSVAPPNFPENNRNIRDRNLVSGVSVNWSSNHPELSSWSQNNKYRSPDLSSLVQAVVNKNQWNADANAIVFRLDASSGSRDIRSADWGAGGAPVLEIKVNESDIQGGLSDGRTVRDHLIGMIGELEPRTNTPIVDSLYEAARYYRGHSVRWGDERRHESAYTDVRRYKRVSHMDSLVPGTGVLEQPSGCTDADLNSTNCIGEKITGSPVYQSPIVEACQANYIVLLTDGAANSNYSADEIKTYIGHSGSCQNNADGEECSEELVEWMANNDMASTVDGENTVHTFTIAFAFDEPDSLSYLQGLAQKGGGKHFTAGSEAELTNAFNTIIGEILDRSSTFVVPGTTVSQFNRLSHHEDIFFSVFKPARTPRWAGNLKKYKISRTETNVGRIVGQNDNPAVDEDTGFFRENVTSFWSNTNDPDGPEVEKGGAAAILMAPDDRKVLTYYEGASENLTSNQNRLRPDNAALTKEMLEITDRDDDYRSNLLRWARGEDVFDVDNDGSTDDARPQMGDPLHSAPVSIAYGGTAESPDFSIFFGTNDGFLRAIDGETGQEHFAFIPESLLPNLKTLYDNAVTDKHPYGVDGDITRWVNDGDNDPTTPIGTHEDDFVYIYFGLRRGGNHYYALDVTDLNNPKLMWHIDGSESPFDELGQTWSQPVKAQVNVKENGVVVRKDVLIFGGGYDTNQDYQNNANTRRTDSEGRAIFMVEAGPPKSGIRPELIWSAGPSNNHDLQLTDMKYSIPSQVKVGDTAGDGLVHVMFAADLGGQIWRFDVNNGQTVDELVTGGVIAELSEDDNASATRRFYSGVDAATIAYRGERFIALTAGSGWRAKPLDKVVEDRFYMIRQPIPKPEAYTKLDEDDLYDATANLAGSDDPAVAAEARMEIDEKKGWYIKLEAEGQKVLAPPVTAQAVTYFTTYQPGGRSDPCSPAAGTPYLYGVNLVYATPALHKAGELVRMVELNSGNIAPTPTFIVLEDGTPLTLVGPEEMGQTLFGDPVHKTYWFEN